MSLFEFPLRAERQSSVAANVMKFTCYALNDEASSILDGHAKATRIS